MSVLSVSGLSVVLGGRPILSGVSFEVAAGEVFGLVGESGSGKSTILRAVAGLAPLAAGRISAHGTVLGARRDAAARRLVQMVFQDPSGALNPRHRVGRIVAEPLRIHRLDDVSGRVARALGEVGLDPRLQDRFPHQLSGGQRQRVAIARALVLAPPVLLLDEPTSALDMSVQAGILDLLEGLAREKGIAMVLVAHELGVVARLCRRVAVMDRGHLIETLKAADLEAGQAAHPATRRLVAASGPYDRALARTLAGEVS